MKPFVNILGNTIENLIYRSISSCNFVLEWTLHAIEDLPLGLNVFGVLQNCTHVLGSIVALPLFISIGVLFLLE
jgi:hypothetical protein